MGLGDRIKAYRKAAKLTQTELGAAAGIRKSAVSMIESGKSEPSLKVLKAFAVRSTRSDPHFVELLIRRTG